MDLERLYPTSQRFRSKTFSGGPSSSREKGCLHKLLLASTGCGIKLKIVGIIF
jgi:hypothetical protein